MLDALIPACSVLKEVNEYHAFYFGISFVVCDIVIMNKGSFFNSD